MIFWIVCWVITMIILMIPLCYTKERRQMIWNTIFCRRTSRSSSPAVSVEEGAAPEAQEVFHYRLSRAQEDEIRESFLVERLRLYTMEIGKSDIISRSEASDEKTTEPSSSFSSDEVPSSDHAISLVDIALELDEGVISKSAVSEGGVDGIDIEACIDVPRRKRTDSTATETSDDELSDFEGDNTMIAIPIAGECRHDLLPATVGRTLRHVPNGCAICLSCFEVNDKLSWSSNPECSHVFHQSCILDWLQTSGKKALRRRRRNQDASIVSYAFDPVSRITQFPSYCPCCRQEFVLQSVDEETSVDKPGDPGVAEQGVGAESESSPTALPSVGDITAIDVAT